MHWIKILLWTQGGGSEYEEVKCLLTWPYAKMLQVTIMIENDNTLCPKLITKLHYTGFYLWHFATGCSASKDLQRLHVRIKWVFVPLGWALEPLLSPLVPFWQSGLR